LLQINEPWTGGATRTAPEVFSAWSDVTMAKHRSKLLYRKAITSSAPTFNKAGSQMAVPHKEGPLHR
jgi:hypothetical protein